MRFSPVSPREDKDEFMVYGSDGWSFEVRERSAGVYEGVATHVSGASTSAIDIDPDQLMARLRTEASAFPTLGFSADSNSG